MVASQISRSDVAIARLSGQQHGAADPGAFSASSPAAVVSGWLIFQSLSLDRVRSLPVIGGGVRCSVCFCILGVSRGLRRRGVRSTPVLKRFLFVLVQRPIDGILHQSLTDFQELRLVWLRPTPTDFLLRLGKREAAQLTHGATLPPLFCYPPIHAQSQCLLPAVTLPSFNPLEKGRDGKNKQKRGREGKREVSPFCSLPVCSLRE